MSGRATLKTSNGSLTMYSPFMENIIITVKSKPTRAVGLSFGINFPSYHSFPRLFIRENLVIMPAANGIPRYIRTLLATSHIEIFITIASADGESHAGRSVTKK